MVYLIMLNNPWNKGKTKENDIRVKQISETLKSKHIDNFYQWREKQREKGIFGYPSRKLRESKKLAYLTGIILGDGCLTKLRRTECLRLILGTDKPDLANYSAVVMESIFKKKPSIIKRNNSNCYNITIYQKGLSDRLGLACGARKNNKINIPKWILRNDSYSIEFLKGLFEAEGSYSVHLPTYTYNFQFSNTNTSLLDTVENLLLSLGYRPERRVNSVRLRRKSETAKFHALIRFRRYP